MKLKRIIASDFLTTVMSSALSIYIYWFAYQYFSSQKIVSMIGFGQLLGVFLSFFGGGISDSINKLFFIKLLKFLKVILLLAVFIVDKSVNMEVLLIVFMFCSTVIGGLLSPTLESLVPFLVERDEELFRINSIVSSLTQVASVMAVILSALYISFFSFSTVICITFILTALSLGLLMGVEVETSSQTQSVIKNIEQGVRYIFKTAYIRNLIPVALVMNFAFWSIFLLLPKISNDSFSFLNISYSGLELSFALGGIIGGVIFTKYLYKVTDKYGLFKKSLFAQSIVLLLLGFCLLVSNDLAAYIGMIVCWFLYAVINTIFSILYFGSLQAKVSRDIIGSVFGAMLTIFSLVNPFAAIMSGVLVEKFEVPSVIVGLALLMVFASVSLRVLPDIEKAFE